MIVRGQIYFVDLDPVKGREQSGRRPVLVVSVDEINAMPLVVTVAVGTDAKNVPHDYPTNVRLTAKEAGLPMDTVFLCFQVRSLDHRRFPDRAAGMVPAEKMIEVDTALRRVLGLLNLHATGGTF